MFGRQVRICFAVIFLIVVGPCREINHADARSISPIKNNERFREFYAASWLKINPEREPYDLKNYGLSGDVKAVLETYYSVYYRDGVYLKFHIFNSRYTRDYSRFNFFDSTGRIKETWNYDAKLRLKSHTFFHRKNKDSVRVLSFQDDRESGGLQQIDRSTPNVQKNRAYRYEYDERGNWIKRIEFCDSIAVHIVERTIVYFQ